mmetsp:Transcript_108611/g.313697  ORF Transcript_108611/g.313697 Transcript_108611/m.313697 type:complete len:108 (+) Transcript_108611:63-386(+)
MVKLEKKIPITFDLGCRVLCRMSAHQRQLDCYRMSVSWSHCPKEPNQLPHYKRMANFKWVMWYKPILPEKENGIGPKSTRSCRMDIMISSFYRTVPMKLLLLTIDCD